MAEERHVGGAMPLWLLAANRAITGYVEVRNRRRPARDVEIDGSASVTLPDGTAGWSLERGDETRGVLLVHGYGATARSMSPIARHLHARGYRVLVRDDRSLPRPPRNGDLPRNPLEGLLDAVDWLYQRTQGPLAIVGHSMGGTMALGAATERTSTVTAVVTLGAIGDPGRTRTSVIPGWLNRAAVDRIVAMGGPDLRASMGAGALERATVPTLVVHGTEDRVVPVTNAHRLAAAGPHVERVLVRGAGHDAAALFDAVSDRVDAFLAASL